MRENFGEDAFFKVLKKTTTQNRCKCIETINFRRSLCIFSLFSCKIGICSPRYSRHGWLGVKNQLSLCRCLENRQHLCRTFARCLSFGVPSEDAPFELVCVLIMTCRINALVLFGDSRSTGFIIIVITMLIRRSRTSADSSRRASNSMQMNTTCIT